MALQWRDWPEARSATKYDMVGPMARPADILGDDVFNTYGGMAVSLEDARRNGDASDTGHGVLFQRFVEDGLRKLEGKEVGQRLYQWLALIGYSPRLALEPGRLRLWYWRSRAQHGGQHNVPHYGRHTIHIPVELEGRARRLQWR